MDTFLQPALAPATLYTAQPHWRTAGVLLTLTQYTPGEAQLFASHLRGDGCETICTDNSPDPIVQNLQTAFVTVDAIFIILDPHEPNISPRCGTTASDRKARISASEVTSPPTAMFTVLQRVLVPAATDIT
mmetsp:Transcript_5511/g.9838  ORF Transcript_5511/g.9838 Transcript_5511/m.9838 type:complete len:131 (-) Transcript_5511:1424-1816(-)